jgi:hypothetical protein
MSIATELFGGEQEAIRLLLGKDARQGTGWAYIQDQGPGIVSFVGSAKVGKNERHPFRYGTPNYDGSKNGPEGYYSHHFMVGEVLIRPHLLVATNALQGQGLAGLATGNHDIRAMLRSGEIVTATERIMARLQEAGEL